MILTCLKRTKYFLVGFAFFCGVQFVFAQETVSLSVSPTLIEMTANPGQRWESNLRIINANPFDLTVYPEVKNFKPLGENGASQFIDIDPSSEQSTFAEWISVPTEPVVIPAEQTLQIPIIIELPAEVPPGGHYAAVLVGTKPPNGDPNQSRVSTAQVVSSLLFLRVAGDINESGRIRSFRTTQAIIDRPEATFELRFENLGNVHLQPQGEIRIKNMWGQERGVIPVNQQTLFGNVLRDSVRNFSFTWTGEWSVADVGRYTAEATLAYGEDARQFTSADTSFWLIPWKIILGIFIGIALVVWLVSTLIKMYVKKMLALAGVDPNQTYQQQRSVQQRRRISMVAPIEVGILDLRSQFSQRTSNKEVVSILLTFIKTYHLFFVGVIVIGCVLYVVGWYMFSALSDNRSYQVTVDSSEGNITITSEDVAYNELSTSESATSTKRSTPPLVIVNRSGMNGAAATVAKALEDLGFTIERLDTDIGSIEERTVIVYNPEFNEDALQLSTILDGALLSAYQDSLASEPFTIYIGTDVAKQSR